MAGGDVAGLAVVEMVDDNGGMEQATQTQARALGDPTRFAMFRHLIEADGPVRIAELATVGGVSANAVRQHLAVLLDAGLADESTAAPSGRGRPPLEYRATSVAFVRWGGGHPFERLASLLTEMATTGDSALEVGRRAGRAFAAEVPATSHDGPEGDPATRLGRVMRSLGFGPTVEASPDGADMVLAVCPFASMATAAPEVICTLHQGVAEGFVEGTDVARVELDIADPVRAGCVIRLRPSAAA